MQLRRSSLWLLLLALVAVGLAPLAMQDPEDERDDVAQAPVGETLRREPILLAADAEREPEDFEKAPAKAPDPEAPSDSDEAKVTTTEPAVRVPPGSAVAVARGGGDMEMLVRQAVPSSPRRGATVGVTLLRSSGNVALPPIELDLSERKPNPKTTISVRTLDDLGRPVPHVAWRIWSSGSGWVDCSTNEHGLTEPVAVRGPSLRIHQGKRPNSVLGGLRVADGLPRVGRGSLTLNRGEWRDGDVIEFVLERAGTARIQLTGGFPTRSGRFAYQPRTFGPTASVLLPGGSEHGIHGIDPKYINSGLVLHGLPAGRIVAHLPFPDYGVLRVEFDVLAGRETDVVAEVTPGTEAVTFHLPPLPGPTGHNANLYRLADPGESADRRHQRVHGAQAQSITFRGLEPGRYLLMLDDTWAVQCQVARGTNAVHVRPPSPTPEDDAELAHLESPTAWDAVERQLGGQGHRVALFVAGESAGTAGRTLKDNRGTAVPSGRYHIVRFGELGTRFVTGRTFKEEQVVLTPGERKVLSPANR